MSLMMNSAVILEFDTHMYVAAGKILAEKVVDCNHVPVFAVKT